MSNTMSQRAAREGLGSPELFTGGVYITKNGVSELFIQTAAEREADIQAQALERQANALLKFSMLAKQEVRQGRAMTAEEARQKLRDARK
ncbi:MAG: hypothetical protein ACTH8P_03415 [Ewingella sp.]|uniref:hypothetical protein n=1 Tax=Ewingella TaxID=41201 RepID=UPI0017BE0498|nr:hypothetical protein [Pseudomonas reactans]